jgi:hypothetical protein
MEYNRWVRLPLQTQNSYNCFQSEILGMIVDAPWYVLDTVIRTELQTPTVKDEICHCSSQYSAHLDVHTNELVVNLLFQLETNRRI